VRVKVAQVAPRERAKNLDPCARVRKLARWCDELVAMASTEMKFTIIRLQRRSREVRQTVQLSRRRMYHSLAPRASHSEFVEFCAHAGLSDDVWKFGVFVFPSPFILRIFVAILWPEQR